MDPAQIAAAISEQIATIHTESYDTPVRNATSYLLGDLVVAILDIELNPLERRMVEFGKGEMVHEMRHIIEQAAATTFEAVVERETGRRVIAFASHTNLDPPFVTELFRLGPSTAHPTEPA